MSPGPGEPSPDPIECTPHEPVTPSPLESTPPPSQGQTDGAQEKPDFTVEGPPTCTVALGAAPDVADCLYVSVDLRNKGTALASVPVRLTSDTLTADAGLTTEPTLVASPEPKPQEIRVDLRTTDFGQTHKLTIAADPGNTIEEVNEENNSLAVSLALPARETLDPSTTCTAATPDAAGGSDGPTPSDVSTETPAVVDSETPAIVG